MGREIRRVPPDWKHPKAGPEEDDGYIPLFDGYEKRLADWEEEFANWKKGLNKNWEGKFEPFDIPAYKKEMTEKYGFPAGGTDEELFIYVVGEKPDPGDYMLVGVPEEAKTHFQYYEDTTEGTPRSPIFATEQELRDWLATRKLYAAARTVIRQQNSQHIVSAFLNLRDALKYFECETDFKFEEW